TMEDLTAHDSQLLTVASNEGIDVTRKLELAQQAAVRDIEGLLRDRGYHHWCPDHVVVTPWLRVWHTYATLAMVYTDAFYSQLNDRYAGRRDEFGKLAGEAYAKLVQEGLGITDYPVPQASKPEVAALAGALPDDTYYITMAWINERGEEGAAAVPCA